MRKEILFAVITIATVVIIFVFMAQNSRFESNSLVCNNAKNFFKITYSHLKNGEGLSFEKSNGTLKNYKISKIEGNTFQFDDQFSNYKVDLTKNILIETGESKVTIYHCELTKFKM